MMQMFPIIAAAAQQRAAGVSPYLFSDDLDYPDNTAASAVFAITPTVAFGANTGNAPIDADCETSLRLGSPSGRIETPSITPQSSIWAYLKFNTSNATIPISILSFKDAADATIGSVIMLSTGALRINAGGGVNASTDADAVKNSITNNLWVKYLTNGSGATVDLYLSKNGVRDERTLTRTGTSTTNVVSIALGPGSSATSFLLNKLRVSATEIGDNPT